MIQIGNLNLIRGDNLAEMRLFNDNQFDVAVIDPPYGIGEANGKNNSRGTKNAPSTYFAPKPWDDQPPPPEFFEHLFRISRYQVIFGANHFGNMPPASCWLVWDKETTGNDFADAELAFTNFPCAVRILKWRWNGMLQQNMKEKEQRIHPTQKPVALYRWIYQNFVLKFVGKDAKIIDTNLGSGSSAIAAMEFGFDFTGIEIDQDHFSDAIERIKTEMNEPFIFTPDQLVEIEKLPEQLRLFDKL